MSAKHEGFARRDMPVVGPPTGMRYDRLVGIDKLKESEDSYLVFLTSCMEIRDMMVQPVRQQGESRFHDIFHTAVTWLNYIAVRNAHKAFEKGELTPREASALVWDSLPDEVQTAVLRKDFLHFRLISVTNTRIKFDEWVTNLSETLKQLFVDKDAKHNMAFALLCPNQLRYRLLSRPVHSGGLNGWMDDGAARRSRQYEMYALVTLRQFSWDEMLAPSSSIKGHKRPVNAPWNPECWEAVGALYSRAVEYVAEWAEQAVADGVFSLDEIKAIVPACMRGWAKYEVVEALLPAASVPEVLSILRSFKWAEWFGPRWAWASGFEDGAEDDANTDDTGSIGTEATGAKETKETNKETKKAKGTKGTKESKGSSKSRAETDAGADAGKPDLNAAKKAFYQRAIAAGEFFRNMSVGQNIYHWADEDHAYEVDIQDANNGNNETEVRHKLYTKYWDSIMELIYARIDRAGDTYVHDLYSLLFRLTAPGTISTKYLRGDDTDAAQQDAVRKLTVEAAKTMSQDYMDSYSIVYNAAERADVRLWRVVSGHIRRRAWPDPCRYENVGPAITRELVPIYFTSLERAGYDALGWRHSRHVPDSSPTAGGERVLDIRCLDTRVG